MRSKIEAGEHNIRLNSICPAATDGERFQNAEKLRAASLSIRYEEKGTMLAQYSLKRTANVSEVTFVVVYHTSYKFSVMTASRARKELSFKERNIR
jgi:NAD(P)-dependent dehydrogenase (short-subunit alcohol dehydrogenase family)